MPISRKNVLIVIEGDPSVSGRLVEGLRVAASLASWDAARVTVCAVGKAAQLLQANPDLLRYDEAEQARPVLREHNVSMFALNASDSSQLEQENIDAAALGGLVAAADFIMRFTA